MMTIDRPAHRDKAVGFRVPRAMYEKARKRAARERRSLGAILRARLHVWAEEEADSPPVLMREEMRSKKQPKNRYISDDLRWRIWERDNFTCQHCGTRRHLAVDHILSVARGGLTEESNLQTLCDRCNSSKGASLPQI